MPRLKSLLTGLALLLTACTNGSPGTAVNLDSGTVYWRYYDYDYTPIQDISFAGGSGELLTEILGDPFNCRRTNSTRPSPTRCTVPISAHRRTSPRRPGAASSASSTCAWSSAASSALSVNTICIIPPQPHQRAPATATAASASRRLLPGGPGLDLSGGRGLGLHRPQRSAFCRVHQERDLPAVPAEQPEQPEFPQRSGSVPPAHVLGSGHGDGRRGPSCPPLGSAAANPWMVGPPSQGACLTRRP